MPLTLDGTNGVSAVQAGAVESGDLAAGAIGSGDLPAGSVIQMVEDSQIATVATSSTSFVAQGLEVTLTPASTNSRIFITINNTADTGSNRWVCTLFRSIAGGSDVNLFSSNEGLNVSEAPNRSAVGTCAVDSPSTTSSVTYKLFIKSNAGGIIEFPPYGSMTQFMVAMEIAG